MGFVCFENGFLRIYDTLIRSLVVGLDSLYNRIGIVIHLGAGVVKVVPGAVRVDNRTAVS